MDPTPFTRATLDLSPGKRFHSLRRELGISSFGINLMRLAPGQRGRVHRHDTQEEVYLVLTGTLTLIVDKTEHELGPNEIARVAPLARRQLVNRGREHVNIVALGGSGEHSGRDGAAFASWDATEEEGAPPQEIALPEDVPVD